MVAPVKRWFFAMALAACSGGGSTPLDSDFTPVDVTLVGKCSFDLERPQTTTIEPADIFLYIVQDPDGAYFAVTGRAESSEPLATRTMAQPLSELIAATPNGDRRFDFGDRHFIGLQWGGQIHTAVGSTFGTDNAYPQCAAWNTPVP